MAELFVVEESVLNSLIMAEVVVEEEVDLPGLADEISVEAEMRSAISVGNEATLPETVGVRVEGHGLDLEDAAAHTLVPAPVRRTPVPHLQDALPLHAAATAAPIPGHGLAAPAVNSQFSSIMLRTAPDYGKFSLSVLSSSALSDFVLTPSVTVEILQLFR